LTCLGTHDSIRQFINREEPFRDVFLQCASIAFVTICSIFALIVYYLLEPFLSSIIWSLVIGALLYPCKQRLTRSIRHYLQRVDVNEHSLCYDLLIHCSWQPIERTCQYLSTWTVHHWKQCLSLVCFRLTMILIHTDIMGHYSESINSICVRIYRQLSHLFDISSLIVIYLVAILFLYNYSSLINRILRLIASSILFILIVYLLEYLSINARWIIAILCCLLIVIDFLVDRRECSTRMRKYFIIVSIVHTNHCLR
jgi:hypothetical protein